jgi:peptide/nickel transport system ATP-binding protein
LDYDERVTALLQVNHLSIRFRDALVVRDLTFAVEEGEVVGLVGESGSGKSVSALAVLRLLDRAARVEGSIRFRGTELLQLSEEAMRRYRGSSIAMIFQEPMTALNPVMPIGEQIAEALRAHQPELSRRAVRDQVLEAMQSVALPEPGRRYNDYPHQFSGGQRQRILIAMAIINRPQLLIADEPTTALDVTVQAQILDLLAGLREKFGLAMLFISHDLAVVAKVAARVLVMRRGLVLESGSSGQIFKSPQHVYTRSLLGAVPTLRTNVDEPLATVAVQQESADETLAEVAPGHFVRQ